MGAPAPAETSTCPAVPAAVEAYCVPFEYMIEPAGPMVEIFVPPLTIGKIPVTSVVKLNALYVGAPAALPCKRVVVVPAAPCIIPVPFEIIIDEPDKAVLELVPPLAMGKVPVTCVVKPILPQLGAAPIPPLIIAFPVATSAKVP